MHEWVARSVEMIAYAATTGSGVGDGYLGTASAHAGIWSMTIPK